MKSLAEIFNINVYAYAVMSNHYHLVLKINQTEDWNEKQILAYWSQLCQLPLICEKFMNGEHQGKTELEMVYQQTNVYRKRLMSISWFMKVLNEYIAKTANQEDKVTGSFFESRFKSQALIDERALLTSMAYVDLNPISAAMAQTPENSDYTSIQERIKSEGSHLINLGFNEDDVDFTLTDYCDLVDVT